MSLGRVSGAPGKASSIQLHISYRSHVSGNTLFCSNEHLENARSGREFLKIGGSGGKLTATTNAALTKAARVDEYDVLVLDAAYKQSLASVRSLGRAGLRVAAGECSAECDLSRPVPAFRSRYCAGRVVLPSYAADATAFAAAVVDFVREHSTRMVLPNGDGTIAALIPRREELSALGCMLALAPNAALEIASNKDRTLEIATRLGIDQPKTMRVDDVDDLPAVFAEFAFPFVLKPTVSWTGRSGSRVVPIEVVSKAEAVDATKRFLTAGSSVLAQEWACGRREGVTLFIVGDDVLASCAHAAYRTSPPLGGASVMRESIPIPQDIYTAAVRLTLAIGMQGVCEVEFRRDAGNRALLMEVNPRLAGTIYNAIYSGVDFPLMIWQWAAGLPIDRVEGYRTGVRTRWLHGDLRWLQENQRHVGRPDTMSRGRALWTFTTEFIRTRHYDCFDWRDLSPVMTELRTTAAAIRKSRYKESYSDKLDREGSFRVH
jgi:predicted ATP-grasp superfamily ATP-dependent carboligase